VDELGLPADAGARPVELGQAIERGAAEEDEALAVVPVVAVRGAVEAVAVVVVLVLEQVHRHPGGPVGLDQSPLRGAIAEGHPDGRHPHPRGARSAAPPPRGSGPWAPAPRYLGLIPRTSGPRPASARGRAPATSASPP